MAFLSETFLLDKAPKNNNLATPKGSEKIPALVVGELSPHLKCLVCGNLYEDPVISVKCGHTFCDRCTVQLTQCPQDGEPCNTSQLVVNKLVVAQISDLLVHCKYGTTVCEGVPVLDQSGCQEKITYGTREDHESSCPFAPAPCPHNAQRCGKFRKSELEQHLKTCCFVPCDHKMKGCEFMGTMEDIIGHSETCGYRGLPKSVSLKDFHDQNKFLQENNRELREQVRLLTQKVEQLESGRDKLQSQINSVVSNLQALNQKCEAQQTVLDTLLHGRNRRSTSSPGNTTDVTHPPRSSSTSSLSSRKSPPVSLKVENWQMPFQFKCIGSLRGHKNTVWCLATYKNKTLCSSGADGTIKIWDLEQLKVRCLIKTLEGHTGVVHTLVVIGDFLYSGGEDLSIRRWSMETLSEQSSITNAHDNIISAMTGTSEYLFTSSHSLIKIWDIKTLTLKHTLSGLHHWVRALCLNTTRDKLYSGSHNTIDIWDAAGTFELKGKISHSYGSIYSLAVTHQYVVAGTYNRVIQVFDIGSMEHVGSLKSHVGIITSLIATPSGRFLLSSCSDMKIMVFDCDTKEHIHTFVGHISTATSIIASSSGRFCFSSSMDKTIQIWDLEKLLPIQALNRHEGSVNTLQLLGDYLISGSEDREIKVFKVFQMQMGFA